MRFSVFMVLILLGRMAFAQTGEPAKPTWMNVVDLSDGESRELKLRDGTGVRVRLIGREDVRDTVTQAVRTAKAWVSVNDRKVMLQCGTYNLPRIAGGVQIDCAITRGLLDNARSNIWALDKDARLRLWPAGSPWLEPGTYVYPVRQRWFASNTQMSNEPSFVDGSEMPGPRTVYYHYGLDTGGAEKLVQIVSATDGIVVVRGREALPEYAKSPFTELARDGVITLDARGWFHWYFHLSSIDAGVKLGEKIRKGENIGLLGKEGSAGCWSHLHYEIRALQPSGRAGIVEGYAFFWEAYRNQYVPEIVAVARPHVFAAVGETVTLDGSRSWSRSGSIQSYEWTLSNSSKLPGPSARTTYDRPGTYSEILKVCDGAGHTAYDFAVVQVSARLTGRVEEEDMPPTIHAAYAPTFDLRVGRPITFLVRTCRTVEGLETWDFGDGTPPVTVKSDGCADPQGEHGYARTEHIYAKPGDYLVYVERSNRRGEKATARLHVSVGNGTIARSP
jgi:murein DD-endopeptidase MepM/ murein hydrolase activator NlpD